MKKILALLFIVFAFTNCNDKPVALVTINASAYVDANKVAGNFAIFTPTQAGIFADEGAVDRYFATIQQNAKTGITDFSAKVLPGEFVIVIQLKNINTGLLNNTYTYNYITVGNTSAPSNYVMQFQSGRLVAFQPWVDKK